MRETPLCLEIGKKRRGQLAPSLLSVCSGIASVYWGALISIGKVPSGMEDQMCPLGHQRKFNFVYRIGYLVVVVVYPVEEKDHWDIKLSEVVVVRTVVKTIGIVFSIVSVI
jgi:hypothetical protein